jgi:excisionase family DNA binding protein
MRIRDVAKRLDVSESLVRGLLRTGRLKGYRHGLKRGIWRISEDQLQEYMHGAESVPPQAPTPRVKLKHLNL